MEDLLILSFVAGGADAAGYLSLGHVFTSNMTGNVVLLGIALGQEQWRQAVRSAFVLVVFVGATFGGAWLARRAEEKAWPELARRVMSWEAAVLGAFALAWTFLWPANGTVASHLLILLLTLAMGLQSAALNRFSAPGVTTTAVTGTLTSLGGGLVQSFLLPGPTAGSGMSRVSFQLMVVLLYCGGAVLTGFLLRHAPHGAGWVPGVLVAVVALRNFRR